MARIVAVAVVFWLLPAGAPAQSTLSSAATQMGLSSAALQMRAPSTASSGDLFTAAPGTYAPTFEEPPHVAPPFVPPFFPCCGAFVGAPLFYPGFYPGVVHVPGYFPGFANAIGSVEPLWAGRSTFRRAASAGWLGYLRLLVEPGTAQVYVDGYYMGTAASLGRLLTLEPGPHRVELRAPGSDTFAVDIRIRPNETITYDATLPSGGSVETPAAPSAPAAPGPPKTFYVIPRCYAGDRPPEANALPRGCDIANVRAVPPVVK
jgi:hypothetical protein